MIPVASNFQIWNELLECDFFSSSLIVSIHKSHNRTIFEYLLYDLGTSNPLQHFDIRGKLWNPLEIFLLRMEKRVPNHNQVSIVVPLLYKTCKHVLFLDREPVGTKRL